MKGIETPISEWRLNLKFEDEAGQRITCNRETACTMGAYTVLLDDDGETQSPACQTCEFSAALTDVFNPDEERFVPDAPDDFKVAAARVMIRGQYGEFTDIMRRHRPETLAMMESVLEAAEVTKS